MIISLAVRLIAQKRNPSPAGRDTTKSSRQSFRRSAQLCKPRLSAHMPGSRKLIVFADIGSDPRGLMRA